MSDLGFEKNPYDELPGIQRMPSCRWRRISRPSATIRYERSIMTELMSSTLTTWPRCSVR